MEGVNSNAMTSKKNSFNKNQEAINQTQTRHAGVS